MKIAVVSLTQNGLVLSQRIADMLGGEFTLQRYAFHKYKDNNCIPFSQLHLLTAQLFFSCDALVFLCACGIAVRMIAPYLQSKTSDPAVIVIDEQGHFAVSLLSGHLGGANSLTKKLAECIHAIPVITTATDTGRKFSPDSFARANRLYLCEMNIAKNIASFIVNNQKIALLSDYPFINRPDKFFDDHNTAVGIYISADSDKMPFTETLHLVPENIVLGVGCKKNICTDSFESFILQKLEEQHIPLFRICEMVSIDLKQNEKALLDFSAKYHIPLVFHSAEELNNIQGNFSSSAFVRTVTGVDNVCERSALHDGGKLLVTKQCGNGVTLAIGEKNIIIDFERDLL